MTLQVGLANDPCLLRCHGPGFSPPSAPRPPPQFPLVRYGFLYTLPTLACLAYPEPQRRASKYSIALFLRIQLKGKNKTKLRFQIDLLKKKHKIGNGRHFSRFQQRLSNKNCREYSANQICTKEHFTQKVGQNLCFQDIKSYRQKVQT